MTRRQLTQPPRLRARQNSEAEASSIAREAVYECIRSCEASIPCVGSRCVCPSRDNIAVVNCLRQACGETAANNWHTKLSSRCPHAFDPLRDTSTVPTPPTTTTPPPPPPPPPTTTQTIWSPPAENPTPTNGPILTPVSNPVAEIPSETATDSIPSNPAPIPSGSAADVVQSLTTDETQAQDQSSTPQSDSASYEPDEFSAFPLSDATPGPAPPTPAESPSTTPSLDVTASDTSPLDPGTIGGTVLGALGTIVICLALWYCCRRRRRKAARLMISSPVVPSDNPAGPGADRWATFKGAEYSPTYQTFQTFSDKTLVSEVPQHSPAQMLAASYIGTKQNAPQNIELPTLRTIAEDDSHLDVHIPGQDPSWPAGYDSPAPSFYGDRIVDTPGLGKAQSTRESSLDLAWVTSDELRKSGPLWVRPRKTKSIKSKKTVSSVRSRKQPSIARQSILSSRSGSTARYTYRSGSTADYTSRSGSSARHTYQSGTTTTSRFTRTSAKSLLPPPPSLALFI